MNDIVLTESSNSEANAADRSSVIGMFKYVWHHTKELFSPPHVSNMLMLGFNTCILYTVSYGIFLW